MLGDGWGRKWLENRSGEGDLASWLRRVCMEPTCESIVHNVKVKKGRREREEFSLLAVLQKWMMRNLQEWD